MYKTHRGSFVGLLQQLAAALTCPSPFLKERLFGLSNPQGNHGESLKEAHFHLDNTPVSILPAGPLDSAADKTVLSRP